MTEVPGGIPVLIPVLDSRHVPALLSDPPGWGKRAHVPAPAGEEVLTAQNWDFYPVPAIEPVLTPQNWELLPCALVLPLNLCSQLRTVGFNPVLTGLELWTVVLCCGSCHWTCAHSSELGIVTLCPVPAIEPVFTAQNWDCYPVPCPCAEQGGTGVSQLSLELQQGWGWVNPAQSRLSVWHLALPGSSAAPALLLKSRNGKCSRLHPWQTDRHCAHRTGSRMSSFPRGQVWIQSSSTFCVQVSPLSVTAHRAEGAFTPCDRHFKSALGENIT